MPKRSPIPVNDHEAIVVLTRSMVALVDLEDAELVGRHLWHAYRDRGGTWYARTNTPRGSRPASIRMHRLIMGGEGAVVDHIDGNGLNNRKSNLRPASGSQNAANSGSRSGTSQFKGVCWDKRNGLWEAKIHEGGRQVRLGYFHDESEAASCYDAAALRIWGEFARLNFPHPVSQVGHGL